LFVVIIIDARWYTREEVLAVLNHRSGTRFTGRDYKKMNDITEGKTASGSAEQQKKAEENAPAAQQEDEPAFRVPPIAAIAGVLIRDWADGKIGGNGDNANIKGNL
jgi:NAD+ diphosphatase